MRFHLKYILEVGGGPELCAAPVRRLFGAERTPLVPQIRTAPLFEPLLQGEHKIMRSRTKKDNCNSAQRLYLTHFCNTHTESRTRRKVILKFRTPPLFEPRRTETMRARRLEGSGPEILHSAFI